MTQRNTLKEFLGRGIKLKHYTYDIIRPRLQKDINTYNTVINAQLKTLNQCYDDYSWQKEAAYYNCCDDFNDLFYRLQDANISIYDFNYGVISYNTFMFTFGGYIRTRDINDNITTYVIYNTPSKSIIYIY